MPSRGTISVWGDLPSGTGHGSLFLTSEGRRNQSYKKSVEEPVGNPSSQEKYTNASSARLSFLGGEKKPKKPKTQPKITLTSICSSHYPDFLKATETHQNSGSHAGNWDGNPCWKGRDVLNKGKNTHPLLGCAATYLCEV